jgi:hypothetical protein
MMICLANQIGTKSQLNLMVELMELRCESSRKIRVRTEKKSPKSRRLFLVAPATSRQNGDKFFGRESVHRREPKARRRIAGHASQSANLR